MSDEQARACGDYMATGGCFDFSAGRSVPVVVGVHQGRLELRTGGTEEFYVDASGPVNSSTATGTIYDNGDPAAAADARAGLVRRSRRADGLHTKSQQRQPVTGRGDVGDGRPRPQHRHRPGHRPATTSRPTAARRSSNPAKRRPPSPCPSSTTSIANPTKASSSASPARTAVRSIPTSILRAQRRPWGRLRMINEFLSDPCHYSTWQCPLDVDTDQDDVLHGPGAKAGRRVRRRTLPASIHSSQ